VRSEVMEWASRSVEQTRKFGFTSGGVRITFADS